MAIDTMGYDPSDYDPLKEELIRIVLSDRNTMLSNIANTLANSGKYEQAKQVIMMFQDEPENQIIRIGLLAQIMIKANKIKEANAYLIDALSLSKNSNLNFEKQVYALYVIAETYRLLGQNEIYFKIVESIISIMEKDLRNFGRYENLLLNISDSLVQLKNKELAVKVLKLELAPYEKKVDRNYRRSDEPEFFAQIIVKLIELNQPDITNEISSILEYKSDQTLLQVALAKQYFKSNPTKAIGYLQKAKSMIKDAEWLEDKINVSLKIISIYNENKMKKEALAEIQEMLKNLTKNNPEISKLYIKPPYFSDVVETLIDFNLVDQALSVAYKIPYPDDKASGLFSVAAYYINVDQIDVALKLANDIHGGWRWDSNSSLYESIAEKYLEKRDLDKALFYIGKANTTDQANFFLDLVENAIKSNQTIMAQEYLGKAFELYKVSNWSLMSQESLSFRITELSAKLGEEKMLNYALNDGHGLQDSKLSYLENVFFKKNNLEKFLYYLLQIPEGQQKNLVLLRTIYPDSPEKIREVAYQEAIKTGNKAVISLFYTNQAKQLIEQNEYEKALVMVEKIDLYYDKATILTLLAIHWEKPNLTGANGQIIHRIIASCNR